MSWQTLLFVVLCCGALVHCDQEADDQMSAEFTQQYMNMLMNTSIPTDTPLDSPEETIGTEFKYCKLPPLPPTTSVHNLSPESVDVVAAMGDSITAAFGARSTSLLNLFIEYRGLSWSIGGQSTLVDVTTLPNALEHFNKDIKGFSTGIGNHRSRNAVLNVAVTGARTRAMLEQAVTLVRKMQEKGITDEEWKVITLWIGGNDLCDVRNDRTTAETLAAQYTENVKQALDYLKANVKRAFINLVQIIDIAGLSEFQGIICGAVHKFVCNGIFNRQSRAKVTETARQYNANLEQLIDGGNTYESDDFTVVLQPFFTQTEVPRQANGEPDDSYFAPDCFHFSQSGHGAVATYLWNNMFEPVDGKTNQIDWDNLQPLKCPADWPYFSTYSNMAARRSALLSNGGSSVLNSSRPASSASLLAILSAAVLGVAMVQLL